MNIQNVRNVQYECVDLGELSPSLSPPVTFASTYIYSIDLVNVFPKPSVLYKMRNEAKVRKNEN